MAGLIVALCGLVVVVICAACLSGSVEDLERQAELQARLMRVEGNEADDAD